MLYAQETLSAVKANKQAISQQLELARKSFEVGTATITDTHEAQARFDLASAQEIAAERSRSQAARAANHRWPGPGPLAQLRKTAELTPPQPNSSMNDWVAAARKTA